MQITRVTLITGFAVIPYKTILGDYEMEPEEKLDWNKAISLRISLLRRQLITQETFSKLDNSLRRIAMSDINDGLIPRYDKAGFIVRYDTLDDFLMELIHYDISVFEYQKLEEEYIKLLASVM